MTRRPVNAIKLLDGSFLVPSGCCRPGQCAPSRGTRCCLSARCDCDWPNMYVGFAPAPAPAGPAVAVRYGAIAAALGAAGWVVWLVATHLLAAVLVIVALSLGGLVTGLRHRSCTTTVTHKHN